MAISSRGNDMKNMARVYVGNIPKIEPENPLRIHRPREAEPWLASDNNHGRMVALTNNELILINHKSKIILSKTIRGFSGGPVDSYRMGFNSRGNRLFITKYPGKRMYQLKYKVECVLLQIFKKM